MTCFVLVGGWPGSGKTSLTRALAPELGLAQLSKDELKEALMDTMGTPSSVEESRALGIAAVACLLRAAEGCPGAVIDSTWFPRALPLLRRLSGPFVEVRCLVPLDVARRRYVSRNRDERHLDAQRPEAELWGEPVAPLGVGPLIEVDTTRPVDAAGLARRVRSAVATHDR